MGTLFKCCLPNKELSYEEEQLEKKATSLYKSKYRSSSVIHFKDEESDYILLHKISFIEYTNLIIKYNSGAPKQNIKISKSEITLSCKDKEFKENFPYPIYESFISSQLIHRDLIEQCLKSNPEKQSIFINWLAKIYQSLIEIMKEGTNKLNIEGRKYMAIAIGFVYCDNKKNKYKEKIKFLFNTFKNNQNLISKKSIQLANFLRCVLLIPTFCLLKSKNLIQKNYQRALSMINEADNEELNEKYKYTNIEKLKDILLQEIFGNNDLLNEKEFFDVFSSSSEFDWFINSYGIKSKLESISKDETNDFFTPD